jgi:hypothetical protein
MFYSFIIKTRFVLIIYRRKKKMELDYMQKMSMSNILLFWVYFKKKKKYEPNIRLEKKTNATNTSK